MTFTNPIWLWGLTGLAVPITIHFLNRKEGRVIRLGSLRHLQDSITNQSVSVRLNEILLLILRCLLIIVTVLLLAELSFSGNDQETKWLLIEPGVNQSGFPSDIDSLKKQGYIPKQFSNDFPDLEESSNDTLVNYWALAEKLTELHSGPAVVISQNRLEGFSGKRVTLPENIRWLSVDPDSSTFDLTINKINSDSIVVRRGNSNAYMTSFTNEEQKSAEQSSIDYGRQAISVSVVSSSKYQYDEHVVAAALRAISKNSMIPITVKVSSKEEYKQSDSVDWLIWLSESPIPQNVKQVIYADTTDNRQNVPLIADSDCPAKTCWRITRRLHIQNALDGNLVLHLSSILLNDREKALSNKFAADDRRTLPEPLLWSADNSPISMASLDQTSDKEATVPLVIILMGLLVSERWMAMKRNQ